MKLSIRILVCTIIVATANILFAKDLSNSIYLKPLTNDVILGDKAAPVTIIEYSSFSCPHCAYFHKNVFEHLKLKYIDKGKLKYIHRDYPLDKIAYTGSILVHCAPTEKYYSFLKVLFEKQENWIFNKNYIEILENIAKLGGMSGDRFHQCLSDKNIEKSILESRMIANNELDIKATPTFFINGKIYSGMHNLEFFEKIIDQIIN